jgi:CIC family chloride channel protein
MLGSVAARTEGPSEPARRPPTRRPTLAYWLALIAVALGAAGFAIAFRALLEAAYHAASGAPDVVTAFKRAPAWARLGLPAVGGLLAGVVARMLARSKGGGVGDVMEAVVFGRVRLSMRTTLLKSAGSWLAIVTGGSIGREGPLIQFGGSLGDSVARAFGIDEDRARALMAAGMAAGFAAAYNTPIAAVLFVLEVVTGIVALDAVLGAVVATTIATAVTRAVIGGGPIYGQRSFELASPWELVAYAGLGLAGALAASGFMRLLSGGETLFARTRIPQPWRAAAGGLVVGGFAVFMPQVTGNGYEPLNAMLDGEMALGLVAWLVVAKCFATTASVSSGSPGGVFTPTLLFGAGVGLCLHAGLVAVLGDSAIGSPGAYALVGMASATAATTHAPLMAAVLVFELSGDYAIVLPLLLATAVSTLFARATRSDSLYSAELRRRGIAWELTLEGRRVVNTDRTEGDETDDPNDRDTTGRATRPPPSS